MREKYFKGADRPVKPKYLKLAVFTERLLDEHLTWPQRRAKWNATVSRDWHYPTKTDPQAKRFALTAAAPGSGLPASRGNRAERQ